MHDKNEGYRWECPMQDDLASVDQAKARIVTWLGQTAVDILTSGAEAPYPIALEIKLRYTALIATVLGSLAGPASCEAWFSVREQGAKPSPLQEIQEAETLDQLRTLLDDAIKFAKCAQNPRTR